MKQNILELNLTSLFVLDAILKITLDSVARTKFGLVKAILPIWKNFMNWLCSVVLN